MKVEEQNLTLCFPTPIWRFEFNDYESVNAAILEELERIGWDRLDERQRAIEAVAGTMLVFPGWPPHKAPKNNGTRDGFLSAPMRSSCLNND